MDKTEITQKRHELRKNILSVYQLEKELTQEFLANHPNIVGTVLKYKSGNATTYKKITGLLSYDSFQPILILQCVIDKITFADTVKCITGLVEYIPFSHFSTYRTTSEDYETAARDFIKELCQGPQIQIADEDIEFSNFNTAKGFNQFYYIIGPEADNPDESNQDTHQEQPKQ